MFSMKSLMRPVASVLCAAMITYWPLTVALQAEPPRPVKPAEPVPVVLPEQLLDTQATTFTKLFNEEYNAEEWTYPLFEQVKEEGTYKGENHLGQPFTLDVLMAAPVDVATLDGIRPAEREWAIKNGFQYTGVIGTLSTDLATVPVMGLACFQSNDTVDFDSRFILVNTADSANALFNPIAVEVGACELSWIPIFIPKFCKDPDCIDDCLDEFVDCVDEALEDFDEAVAAADAAFDIAATLAAANRDAAVNAANATYNAAKSAADTQLAVALAACTATLTAAHIGCAFVTAVLWWTGGAATLACVVAAQAAYAGCVAISMVNYNTTVNAAAAARDAAINAANASYAAEIAAAEATRELALTAAYNALADALEDCVDEYDDCVEDCPWIICGWIIIWIPIPGCW